MRFMTCSRCQNEGVPTMGDGMELKDMGDQPQKKKPPRGFGHYKWLATKDPASGQEYFYNPITKERTWQNPMFRKTRPPAPLVKNRNLFHTRHSSRLFSTQDRWQGRLLRSSYLRYW